MLEQFHFIRPGWLLMLIPLAVAVWLLLTRRLGARSWEQVCDPQLLPYVLIQPRGQRRRYAVTAFTVIGVLTVLALAGPTWERLPQPVYRSDSALVILMDLSRSMDASDVPPTRLERARYKVVDILDQRKDGETALIVYAGDAFTVTPLTTDVQTIKAQLPSLSTGLMPLQGHRADLALSMAANLLKQAGHARGQVILVADEVDVERDAARAEQLREQGYRVSVLGVGTGEGSPVNLANGGFLKDNKGRIVVPTLDSAALREVAVRGGGVYRTLQPTDRDVRTIMDTINAMPNADNVSETTFQSDRWLERGPWLLLLVAPLVALSFRRGIVFCLALLLLPLPRPAAALDWDSLWLNDDQRARKLLEQGRGEEAAKLFTDERWRAAAEYRAEMYDKALATLKNLNDPESVYNKGNALARSGQYPEAVAAYEEVLEAMPDHEDARYNLELVKKELAKQKPPPQQDPSGGGDKKPNDDADAKPDKGNDSQDPAGDKQSTGTPDSNQDTDSMAQENAGDQEVSGGNEQQRDGEEDRQQQAGRPGDESNQAPPEQSDERMAGDGSTDEESPATEQWLRRIPDDPGGLLRKKFMMQYKERGLSRHNYEQDW